MPISFISVVQNFNVNSLSQSEVIISGIPWSAITFLNSWCAISSAVIVPLTGVRLTYFINQSIMTWMLSNPSDSGSCVMKSIVIHCQDLNGASADCIFP